MKQNLFTLLFFALLMPSGLWARNLYFGEEFTVDGILYVVINTNPLEVSVGGGNGVAIDKETTGAIVLPDVVKGPDDKEYSVTDIGASAFRGCKGLTSVTIGRAMKGIQYAAFYECSNLATFNIPTLVTDVGLQAFEGTAWYNSQPDGLMYKDNVLLGSKGKKLEGDLEIANGTRVIADGAIFDCDITSVSMPNSIMHIGSQSFQGCVLLKSVTIPSSVKYIGFRAFAESGLSEIRSFMEEPCLLAEEAFRYKYINAETYYNQVTLHVPAGTKAKYEATEGWKEFKNIVEMGTMELEPIEAETTVNTNNLAGQSLADNVVNDVYYNVGSEGYDASDQSVVISQATNMGQISDATPGSADVKENFNGMILKVAKGKGLITVNVKTSGNAQLVVQVGNGTPMLATKTEKDDVVFSYDVEEDTYVYIYAIIGSSAAKGYGLNATDIDSSVRIYSITVSPGATGIRSVGANEKADTVIYDLQGRRVENPAKGIYIVGGRKVSVK